MKKTNKKRRTKNSRFFSIRHYVYVILAVLAVIFLIWYVASWYKVKKEERLLTSYLIKTNTVSLEVDDISEIPQMLKELPSEYFIYISYTNDESIYRLERKLKKIIDTYDIADTFYYINVTNESKTIETKLNDMFSTTKIVNIPCILYFKNNELKDIIVEKDDVFDYNKFIILLQDNEYEKEAS